MATKKEITKELLGLGVTLKDQHYTHADLTDLLKKAKVRVVDPPESEVQVPENTGPQLSAAVLAEMAAVAAGENMPPESDDQVQGEPAEQNGKEIVGEDGLDKEETGVDAQTPPETEEPTPPETEEPETEEKTTTAKVIWPNGHTICPRCRVDDTEAYSTKGIIQYRKCRRAICRKNFTVRGKKAKSGKNV